VSIRPSSGRRSRLIATLVAAIVVIAVCVEIVQAPDERAESLPVSTEAVVSLAMNLVIQHKDTVMPCVPDGPSCPAGIHAWNHASGPDGLYNTPDDCPHCSCYCAPASISMIAQFRGMLGVKIQQDDIYDNGKSVGELAVGDVLLSTHGVGMFDGSGGMATEVQLSFTWAVGPFTQHDFSAMNPNGPMTPLKLAQYIVLGHPVLWLDHGGFPKNQSTSYPSLTDRQFEGHAKVISGYDDNETQLDTTDDLCLIYDPWPEYSDLSILPKNATKGPGNSFDPYWLPLKDVNLGDIADIYLVDNFPDIPEFQDAVIPIAAMMIIGVMVIRSRSRRDER